MEEILRTFEHKEGVLKSVGIKINEQNYRHDNHKYFKEYSSLSRERLKLVSSHELSDGKTLNVFEGSIEEVEFQNGAKKWKFPNGFSIVNFQNGDVKQVLPDKTVIYFYK